MYRRYLKSVDGNQGEIQEGLETAGYYVVDCSGFGDDFPDLLVVSKKNVTVLLEVKTDLRFLTWGQFRFLWNFPGPRAVVLSLEQALEVMYRYD